MNSITFLAGHYGSAPRDRQSRTRGVQVAIGGQPKNEAACKTRSMETRGRCTAKARGRISNPVDELHADAFISDTT